jgi:hypothetical protein
VLVYLATFPRCGHAFTRNLIFRNFGFVTANGYPAPWEHQKAKLAMRETPEPQPGFRPGLAWGDWTLVYRAPAGGGLRRTLKNDALRLLTPDLRRELAAEEGLYFIKTHEAPPERFFDGEVAIQMVRHPGAAIASHVRLLIDQGRADLSLTKYIHGKPGRSWAQYHDAWRLARAPRLVLRYEDAFLEPEEAIRDIARFLDLDIPPKLVLSPIEEARASDPIRNPGRGIDGWRGDFTEADLDLLWRLHGKLAARFGYGRDVTVSVSRQTSAAGA